MIQLRRNSEQMSPCLVLQKKGRDDVLSPCLVDSKTDRMAGGKCHAKSKRVKQICDRDFSGRLTNWNESKEVRSGVDETLGTTSTDIAGQYALETKSDSEPSSTSDPSSVQVNMIKANCLRASRAARASDPSEDAAQKAYEKRDQALRMFRKLGIERAPRELNASKSFRQPSCTGARGSAVRTNTEDQSRMNHLAALKAKDIDTNNTEPAFLLGGFTAPLLWDRLAENSLRSNAVNSSVMNRKKTQGASNQARACTDLKT